METGSPTLGSTGTFAEIAGHVLDTYPFTVAKYDRPLNHISQFAHVAWPFIILKGQDRLVSEARNRALPTEVRKHPAGQRHYVFPPFPERWQIDVDYIDAIKKILSEPACFDCLSQIDIRGGDQSHIGPVRVTVSPTRSYSRS